MNKLGWGLAAPAVILIGLIGVNYALLDASLQEVLHSDPRNSGIRAHAYFRFGLLFGTPTFDLRGVGPQTSQLDVMRVFLQFAAKLKGNSYDGIVLSWKGDGRFMFQGAYFKSLGQEYDFQNPVYTMRTLPEHVARLDGTQPFGHWEGGLLGVLSSQMNDFSDFQKQWWLNSALAER